jgi:hypothetical protein
MMETSSYGQWYLELMRGFPLIARTYILRRLLANFFARWMKWNLPHGVGGVCAVGRGEVGGMWGATLGLRGVCCFLLFVPSWCTDRVSGTSIDF